MLSDLDRMQRIIEKKDAEIIELKDNFIVSIKEIEQNLHVKKSIINYYIIYFIIFFFLFKGQNWTTIGRTWTAESGLWAIADGEKTNGGGEKCKKLLMKRDKNEQFYFYSQSVHFFNSPWKLYNYKDMC